MKPPFIVQQCIVFLLLVISMAATLAPAKAERRDVQNVRLWHSPDNTRVVFDVSANVTHNIFSLEDPLRLVVDIENADLSIGLPTLDPQNAHIANIRSGRPKSSLLRFVFELKKPLKSNSFLLSPNELYGHRLVVDLDELQPITTKPDKLSPVVPFEPDDKVVTSAELESSQPVIIAIDAGHGGEDPGAIGYRGSHEKKITFSIAEKLRKIIDRDARMRSYMVRKGDYFIKLNKRREMAKAVDADLFISIHADAFGKRSAHGFSVFALSQRGATSAMARALAAKENAADRIGGVSLADKDDQLAKVLVDLSMTNTISDSVNLGGRVLKELGKLGKLHSRRVEQAGFAVLKSADIPSILIETGFVTNPDEERKLKSSRYQNKIANAIYQAIGDYYKQVPYSNTATYASPSVSDTVGGTHASSRATRPAFHKVVRGDSLSAIAFKYGVSVTALKRANGLKRNVAVLGARLKIPGGGKAATSTKAVVHTVKRGESLSKISASYNVTIKAIKRHNKLSRETVYIGQRIKIPGVAGTSVKPAGPKYHKVERGDTLSEIAQRYGSSINKIMRANKLRNHVVMLGQRLRIPND